jgi:uncharacterized protein YabE (DUF348 family)/3D (Asp-Asp-Asp) domain-containing protein
MNQDRSFLKSWKFLVTVGFLIALFTFSIAANVNQPKVVHFTQNGQASVMIETKAKTVGEFLAERSIEMHTYDQLKPSKDAPIEDGIDISYRDRWSVTIHDGVSDRQVITDRKTVGEILRENKILLGEWDRVSPSLTVAPLSNETITITRVEKKWEEQEELIPFHEVKKKDANLMQGAKKIIQKGREGTALLRYEVELENGQEVSRSLKETKVLKEKQDQVVAIGTLTTVSRGGKLFSPRKVLTNVKLTAYGAGPESTGKSPGHPLYGITASGTRVQEGRTIAVDPNVIPLGSWVYIEGYGFRRAEDTGSAIKNNIIDIYFEDDDKAVAFGVKRSPKVYVLGPNQPR